MPHSMPCVSITITLHTLRSKRAQESDGQPRSERMQDLAGRHEAATSAMFNELSIFLIILRRIRLAHRSTAFRQGNFMADRVEQRECKETHYKSANMCLPGDALLNAWERENLQSEQGIDADRDKQDEQHAPIAQHRHERHGRRVRDAAIATKVKMAAAEQETQHRGHCARDPR